MVRTPFSLFDTAPILGVRRPSSFLGLPSISTDPSIWTNSPTPAPSYPYMNARPRYLRRTATQSPKAVSALETSLSPSKTIEALRMHRWSGVSSFLSVLGDQLINACFRSRWTLPVFIDHWYFCAECHRGARSHSQDAVSCSAIVGPRNTHHTTNPSPCPSRNNLGRPLLLG